MIISVDKKIQDCEKLQTGFKGADINDGKNDIKDNLRECVEACIKEQGSGCVAVTFHTKRHWCWMKNTKNGAKSRIFKKGTSLNMDCLAGNNYVNSFIIIVACALPSALTYFNIDIQGQLATKSKLLQCRLLQSQNYIFRVYVGREAAY